MSLDLDRRRPRVAGRPDSAGPVRCFGVLSLVLPKGSLERATLDLFDAADLTVRRASDRDYHASISDPTDRQGAVPAAAGDPFLRGRGTVRLRHYRAGLDHRNRCRGRLARRAGLLQGDLRSGAGRAGRADQLGLGLVSDLPSGIRISTEFPGADQAIPGRARDHGFGHARPTVRPRRRCPTSWTRSSI